jgi:hypothetical protein
VRSARESVYETSVDSTPDICLPGDQRSLNTMELGSTSDLPPAEREVSASGSGSRVVDQFSLVQGGLIYRFQVAIGMAIPDRSGVVNRALLTILITWFPLLLLSLLQNRAFGSQVQIPFLHDFATNIRFLIGLPLLVIAEVVINPRISHAVKHFVKSGLVAPGAVPAFEEAILKMNKLRDSFLPALLILAASFAPSIWYKETELLGSVVSTWHSVISPSGESLSLAGWWFGIVSLPLFRVLLFRWVWMIFLWAVFLRSVTKIELGCIATHPDTCGGLGFLAEAQLVFSLIGFASSVVFSGAFGNAIAYQGATVSSLKFLMIASCLLVVVVLAVPLLVLTPKLVKVKRRGIYDYGALGTAYARAFDAKWIKGPSLEREPILGTADIQSLADLRNSFSVVEEMKVVLVDKKVLIGLAISVILPMIALIVIVTPTEAFVRAVLKLLL